MLPLTGVRHRILGAAAVVGLVTAWTGLAGPLVVQSAVASSQSKATPPSVSTTSQTFVDNVRHRTLVTTFFVSTPRRNAGPLPVVVFVHGYDQTPTDYRPLLKAWAGAGYLVVAPAFPGTVHGAAGGIDSTDYRNQPGDVSFLISQVLAAGAAPTGVLAGRVDPTRVGIAGHSLGAEVVLGLLNRCCRDPRVQAAISLAGSEQFNPGVPAFPRDGYFVDAHVPLLLVHGDADEDNPYDRSQAAFGGASAPKFFETIHGANHTTPYQAKPTDDPGAKVVTAVTIDFLDRYLKGQTSALDRLTRDGTVHSVATLQAVPA